MPYSEITVGGDDTFTTDAWVTLLAVQGQGGGGNGGDSDNVLPGGGGGEGATATSLVTVSPSTGYFYHNSNGSGDFSRFIDSGTLYIASGDNGTAGAKGAGGLLSNCNYNAVGNSNGTDGNDPPDAFTGGDGSNGASGGTVGNNGSNGDLTQGGGGAGLGVGTVGGTGGAGAMFFFWAPPYPTGLSAAVVGATEIDLTWDTITDPSDYQYRYGTSDPPTGGTPTSTGTTNSANVTGLSTGTYYYFQVRAKDATGLGGYGTTDQQYSEWSPSVLLQAGSATAYTFDGPSSGTVNVASTDFTVTPDGLSSATVTPASDGAGSFTPSSVTFSGSGAQTFTYTPTSTTGSPHTLTVTNDGGLTDPASIDYTVNSAPAADHNNLLLMGVG